MKGAKKVTSLLKYGTQSATLNESQKYQRWKLIINKFHIQTLNQSTVTLANGDNTTQTTPFQSIKTIHYLSKERKPRKGNRPPGCPDIVGSWGPYIYDLLSMIMKNVWYAMHSDSLRGGERMATIITW